MTSKIYIQPISGENDNSAVGELYMPSSVGEAGVEFTSEMMRDLKESLRNFVGSLADNPIDGWTIEQIELGISFSSDVKAWVINVGGSGTMKIKLKPAK
ncbi:hypothetical protein FC50_GL001225 [Lacticaseibacillus pantheris DSM 15945 = JCM 12539 = NBRC 106106]|uniref:Uncharacterized protein n=1 Tax=Lacticaseibacillus pantheris DSM 15945 = JCM 12539 = NBRC 106106 TaxID=1423783 RepID=A0A0R1TX15_9LACO|nr:hypothetical protein [Lacticaseibacillus pantheris]KRL85833.1 hypothetical protein FC50_GL001225 [Lacticaseibacillus pantheris DSM 15945 = JCM 12539 = NBRC 106106]